MSTGDRRIRTCTRSTEVRSAEDGKIVMVGYGATFGDTYLVSKKHKIYERIERGAFDKTLADGHEVRSFMDHKKDKPLGSTVAGNLRLAIDEHGLHVEIEPPEVSYVADAVKLIKTNIVRGMSIGFDIVRDRFERDAQGRMVCVIEELDLDEVSPSSDPFNVDTELGIQLRGVEDFLAREQEAMKRRQLHIMPQA